MKKKLAIITDSSCGSEYQEIEDCYLIPLILTEKNGSEITEYEDLVTITTDEVFNKLAQGKDISTSQMKFGNALLLVEELLEKYEDVFLIGLSKGLSGSYHTWLQIKEEIGSNNFHVFDSNEVGHGIYEMIIQLKELYLKQKKSIDEIHEFVKKWNDRRQAQLIVNDIDSLIKGGRVSILKGKIAKLLHIKISVTFKSDLDFFEKSSSLEKITDKSLLNIDKTNNFIEKGVRKILFFKNFSNDNFKEFNEFRSLCINWLKDKNVEFNDEDILDTILPSVITVHTGVNSYGIWILANDN